MKDSNMIRKMKSLMAMANDKSSENEAMTAARQLQAMLAKHNISMEQLEDQGEEQEEVSEASEDHVDRPWKRLIAHTIAKLYFCNMYYVKATKGKSQYFFVGTEVNREFAMQIFNIVVRTVEKESRKQSKEIYGKKDSSFVTSFRTGAMNRIRERCDEMIEAAKKGEIQDEDGTNLPAMVSIYEANDARIKEFLASKNLKTKSARTRATNGVGLDRGRVTGGKVQLSRGVHGKVAPKAIGHG